MDLHLRSFHKLLFSATLSQNLETIETLHLFQPKLFTSIVPTKAVEGESSTNSDKPENQAPDTSSENTQHHLS